LAGDIGRCIYVYKYILYNSIKKLIEMNIEQIYTGCLAQGAYYITSGGEAAIIDPLREISPYLQRLKKDNVNLKFIFETHFHADFVSGHIDLSKATGAPIYYGPGAECGFDCNSAADGQEFKLGNCTIKALHTPGHTMESTVYLLRDENGKDHCIFSGDTLFLGDVGRPDLAQKAAHMTQEELAGLLYDSLMTKIMPLADDIIVYPAHGAGSACGKNMMKETVDTLGHQKKINYALNQPDRESFIKAVLKDLLPPPAYFGDNVAMNKYGYESFEKVMSDSMTKISAIELESVVEMTGSIVLDTRKSSDFAEGFIPQSINIGLGGDFAPWVGALIEDVKQPLILVTYAGKEAETITRLSRVGFDNVIGYLDGGIDAWMAAGKEIDKVDRISAQSFNETFKPLTHTLIDVRRESEYTDGHIHEAVNKPLAIINDWIADLNPTDHLFIYCASGYRSMIASSILKARGFHHFSEIQGGYAAIKDEAKVEVK
jgi:glyoxylase-like metal-dependent hydrolase (beta-lactamase superfamily II)/rhodanese-related sulfurtransferase